MRSVVRVEDDDGDEDCRGAEEDLDEDVVACKKTFLLHTKRESV